MPNHLTSLFKSAAGIANDVLGNSGNLQRGGLKGKINRDGNGDLLQGKKGEKGENQREEKLQNEDLGLGLGGASIGDEGRLLVGVALGRIEDAVEGGEVGGIGIGTGKIGGMGGRSGRTGGCKNFKLIDMSGSAATNPNEKFPLMPCLRAGDGLDVEVSPTDGLGGFDGKVGEGGCECGSVDEEDGGGRSGIENTEASGLETGGKKHSAINATPASIPLPISSTVSSTNTITTFELEETTTTRIRAFTVPRKPIVTNRRDCLDWKTEYGGYEGLKCGGNGERQKHGERGEGFKSVGSVKSEVIGERKEDRSVRLERERMERVGRDLHHENPLHSHPIQASTISHGTPPTISPLYTSTSSPSINSSKSKSRAFRHSYTVPIHGFHFVGKGVEGPADMESMAGGIGMEGMAGVGDVSTIGRGTARDRYSGNSNPSVSGSGTGGMGIGMGIGSRTGSFLRRASVSFKGLGAGVGIGYMRSSSGGVEGMHAQGWGIHAEKLDSNSNTIPVEFLRGVGGYAGDGMGIGMGGEKIEMDTERRKSDRQSLILPKFEWEDEFVGGNTRKKV
ncbi:52e959a3-6afe-4e38-a263-64857231ca9b [Sclerotinia trifoliorum]|uniref:52e959a3-6afe-4e38-a263-64857231ca9b n=1 Tax=Sclerotinia trifoliorum TaxID=28548 RepID=A0A8H2ZWZ3_9HELO|nr:52e959a3-6afe-4e38-a263-64857231ca9b [Sclerotinia trifoliorum]